MTCKIMCTCNQTFNTVQECVNWHNERKIEVTNPEHSFKFHNFIVCTICGNDICKYEMDFNVTGAVQVNDKNICNDCAKKIAKKVIDND